MPMTYTAVREALFLADKEEPAWSLALACGHSVRRVAAVTTRTAKRKGRIGRTRTYFVEQPPVKLVCPFCIDAASRGTEPPVGKALRGIRDSEDAPGRATWDAWQTIEERSR